MRLSLRADLPTYGHWRRQGAYPDVVRYKEPSMQITKTIRLTGSSPNSIEDGVRTVLARAAATLADITRWDMVGAGGRVDDSGAPTEFEVTVDVTFGIRDSVEHG